MAQFADGDERVAFARIRFSNRPVHHWQMAVWPGQQPQPINGQAYYGYGVDAGMGLFMDEQAMLVLDQRLRQTQNSWEQIFITSFAFEGPTPRQGFLYRVAGQTLAAFMSGFGDGSYASYIGFDTAGQPCRLLTDFQVINWQTN
ncbi:hypothetical protein GCM10027048_33420 [Hymenobacter coalescens]